MNKITMEYRNEVHPVGPVQLPYYGALPEVRVLDVTPYGPNLRWTYVLIWRDDSAPQQ